MFGGLGTPVGVKKRRSCNRSSARSNSPNEPFPSEVHTQESRQILEILTHCSRSSTICIALSVIHAASLPMRTPGGFMPYCPTDSVAVSSVGKYQTANFYGFSPSWSVEHALVPSLHQPISALAALKMEPFGTARSEK